MKTKPPPAEPAGAAGAPIAGGTAHICLVSPAHLSLNPRLVKEAEALLGAGFAVSVVCGCYAPWGMEADKAIRPHLGPVIAVPFGPHQTSKLNYFVQTARRHASKLLVRAGIRTDKLVSLAQHPAARELARAASAIRADLYIAHYDAALPAVSAAARRRGVPFAFDAEDFHPGDLPDLPEHAFENGLIRSIESRTLPHAAFVTAAAPMIASAYAKEYGLAEPTTILNVFPRASAPAEPTDAGCRVPGPSVYWFSQIVGPDRGLETLVDAAARASSTPHLYLRGKHDNAFCAALKARAEKAGIGDRLHFLQPIAPDELQLDGIQFDLGYAGELFVSPNRERALTNKLFTYLSSGIPLVMSETPAQSALAPELGDAAVTFPVGDAPALANAIDAMLQPERLRLARRASWQLGQGRFAWETEAQRLVELVRSTLLREARCVAHA